MNKTIYYYNDDIKNVLTNNIYMHEGVYYMNMKFFNYEHLPEYLQIVSKPFYDLANLFNDTLPECSEKHAGLRKLLEAKDCFVRVEVECAEYIRGCNKKVMKDGGKE